MSRASDVMGANAPVWMSGKVSRPGDLVKSPADRYQLYVRTSAAGSGTTDPSADPGNYTPFGMRAIKSIQRGVIGIPNYQVTSTATISTVNVAKTELRCLGGGSSGNDKGAGEVWVTLTNATTVTAARATNASSSGTNDASVSWELTEYF